MPVGDDSPDQSLVIRIIGPITWSPEWKAISLAYSSQRELDAWKDDNLRRIGSTVSAFHSIYQASQHIILGDP